MDELAEEQKIEQENIEEKLNQENLSFFEKIKLNLFLET